ncbi:four helix bundle protein [Pedobacter sp. MR22-3]|uniref:four helix bundle protein n=1 Tax=Pedobacter sp. MR22-3 TaxID=2994552 RepID=UPI003A5986B6
MGYSKGSYGKENYTDLDVWKQARILSKEIYLASSDFPNKERFGQMSSIRS